MDSSLFVVHVEFKLGRAQDQSVLLKAAYIAHDHSIMACVRLCCAFVEGINGAGLSFLVQWRWVPGFSPTPVL